MSSSASTASDPTGALSVFDAVNRQLGLKLEKAKRPYPVLVIDHIEEIPIENYRALRLETSAKRNRVWERVWGKEKVLATDQSDLILSRSRPRRTGSSRSLRTHDQKRILSASCVLYGSPEPMPGAP